MTEKKTNITSVSEKKLSVQVSLNGLSFLIENDSQDILYSKEIKFQGTYTPQEVLLQIKDHLEKNAQVFSGIKNFTLVHENMLYSVVPKSLFDEQNIKSYLKYNSKIFESDTATFDEIDSLDLVVAYVPLTNINNYFFDLFGEFTFKHSTTIFLENKMALSDKKETMYVHIREHQMDMIIFKNNQLQLVNSYVHSCPEDFIYYVLFAAEQLHLDPETFKLYLDGNVDETSEYFKIAYTYIRHISTETPSPLTIVK